MKIIGLITTVSPYRGSLSPQPISFSTYLFNYRNYHAQTALHELVDDHVFLTSARCKWHSNPNVKKICVVCVKTCWCQSSQVLEGFVFVSGMNALNVKLVKAHWHECSIETMPTYILCIQTFSIKKDLLRALLCKSPCWRRKH